MKYRLGIDVGGTNTDAVAIDEEDTVVAKTKTETTEDVSSGITAALDSVLASVGTERAIDHVMLGTTHCTNAVTERRNLADVAVVRVGAPATRAVPPLYEWPDDLVEAVGDLRTTVEGGNEYDGREIAPLDEDAVRSFLTEHRDRIEGVAVSSVFSPVRSDHEERVAEIADEVLGSVPVSRSFEIGSLALLERENATALNAALTDVIGDAITSLREALDEHDVDANVYIGQNDGTLMNASYAERYPIFTVACGPANSVRGAAYLSDLQDGIVVDVGGTTTDVGALVNGFPRESATAVEIGGVRTNFRMPDLLSIGVGGGSIIEAADGGDPTDAAEVTVGPRSVGYRLTDDALAFGGDTLTATDIAIVSGRAEFGPVDPSVPPEVVERAEAYIVGCIEDAIDRIKTNPSDIPVTVVGGGSILVQPDLSGASQVEKPENYEVANAIGAAIAQISGQVDRVYTLDDQSREEALRDAQEEAIENAVSAGANPKTVEVVDREEIPLSYLPGNAIRLKVKAAGDLTLEDT